MPRLVVTGGNAFFLFHLIFYCTFYSFISRAMFLCINLFVNCRCFTLHLTYSICFSVLPFFSYLFEMFLYFKKKSGCSCFHWFTTTIKPFSSKVSWYRLKLKPNGNLRQGSNTWIAVLYALLFFLSDAQEKCAPLY